MEFSKAQFEALVDEITAGIDEISALLGEIEPAAQMGLNRLGAQYLVPQAVIDAVLWTARKIREFGEDLLQLIKDCAQGMLAPVFMFMDSWQWMDVRSQATGISQALSAQNLVVDDTSWSGTAHSAYVTAAASQSEAAAKISSIASTTSTTLMAVAGAGALFYLEIAFVVSKVIAALVAVVAAYGSVAFSGAGLALAVEEMTFSATAIQTGIALLLAFLGSQVTALIVLKGEANDGSWPDVRTGGFSDATVSNKQDGSAAPWSLAGQ